MKKSLFLLAALALAAASPSFAQTAPTPLKSHRVKRIKTPEQSAEKHTDKLTKSLNLSAEQQGKVKQIMLAQAQEAQALKAKYPAAAQQPTLHQEMKASKAKYQAQLQGVLSADQRGKYAAMQQEHKGKHKDKAKVKS